MSCVEALLKRGKQSGINILCLNIQNLKIHFLTLLNLFDDKIYWYDVIILVEINVKQHELELYSINGYDKYGLCRQQKSGGGVLFYVKSCLCWEEVSINMNSAETLLIKINDICNQPLYIMGIYSTPPPPPREFVEEFKKVLTGIKHENLVIAGDFNIDLNKRDGLTSAYISVMAGQGLFSAVNKITRERVRGERLTRTVIDHLFFRGKIDVRTNVIKQSIADHYLLTANISVCKPKLHADNTKVTIIDEKIVNSHIKLIDWNLMCNNNNAVCDNLNLFTNAMKRIYNKATKKIQIKNKGNNLKIGHNPQLKSLIKEKHRLYREWLQNPNDDSLRTKYNASNNKLKKTTRSVRFKETRKNFMSATGNPRKLWKLINLEMGKNVSESVDEAIIKNICNKLKITPKQAANSFVNEFKVTIDNLTSKCDRITLPKTKTKECKNLCSWKEVGVADIKKVLQEMPVRSPGTDLVRIKDLKSNSHILLPTLTNLINGLLTSTKIPNYLKHSIVRPIYKSGKRTDYSNYRPISILNTVEKVMEKCVYRQLCDHIEINHVLNKAQFGFRKGVGTNEALLEFSNFVHTKLNENYFIFTIFIDFTRAFETLNHTILLRKVMNEAGVCGQALQWLKDYLHDRKMKVKINETFSKMETVGNGVPTGSLLGPLLYLLYVNDMVDHCQTKTKIIQYADDTIIVSAGESVEAALSMLQSDFNKLQLWAHDNGLILNKTKTKIMNIKATGPREISDVIYHDHNCLHRNINALFCQCTSQVQQIFEYRYLGLVVDTYFSFEPHIKFIKKKLRQISCIMYNFQFFTTKNNLKSIYHGLAECHIAYGILSYGTAAKSHLQQIEKIQDYIIENLTPKKIKNPTRSEMYEYLQVLPLTQLFKYKLAVKYHFDTAYRSTPAVQSSRNRVFPNYNTPLANNKHGYKKLEYLVPATYNMIPEAIIKLKKFSSIKKELRKLFSSEIE